MKRLVQAGTAIFAATLFGASAPMVSPHDESHLEAARGLDGNRFFEARITEVDGRAVGTVERVHLGANGEVESLDIRWRSGWTDEPFVLTQSIDRFSYDADMDTLIADARYERLQQWAEEDARNNVAVAGLPIGRVGEGVLSGARTVSHDGEDFGRVVGVEKDAAGTITAVVTVQHTGFFNQRSQRQVISAANARWDPETRSIRLAS